MAPCLSPLALCPKSEQDPMSQVSLSSFLDAGVHGGRAGLRLEPRPRVATAEEGRGAAQADRGSQRNPSDAMT